MNFRMILTFTCMFTLAAACDPDVDVEQLDNEATELVGEDGPRPLVAEEQAEEAVDWTPELSEEFAAPVNPSAAQCFVGEYQWQISPTGICGGCTIGSYPGQAFIRKYRVCQSSGYWGPWNSVANSCEHC